MVEIDTRVRLLESSDDTRWTKYGIRDLWTIRKILWKYVELTADRVKAICRMLRMSSNLLQRYSIACWRRGHNAYKKYVVPSQLWSELYRTMDVKQDDENDYVPCRRRTLPNVRLPRWQRGDLAGSWARSHVRHKTTTSDTIRQHRIATVTTTVTTQLVKWLTQTWYNVSTHIWYPWCQIAASKKGVGRSPDDCAWREGVNDHRTLYWIVDYVRPVCIDLEWNDYSEFFIVRSISNIRTSKSKRPGRKESTKMNADTKRRCDRGHKAYDLTVEKTAYGGCYSW